MIVKYFCSWWGLNTLSLEAMLKKIKSAGYNGVEIGIPKNQKGKKALVNLLDKYKLELIAHQYEAKGGFDEYQDSFRKELLNAAELNPLFINSHTGKDYWGLEKNKKIIEIAFEVEAKTGIKIIHETHRKHFLFSTLTANQYFNLFPGLKITADLSHWTCVSESMLEDQQAIISEAIRRTEHIHARVGYEQGPQIPDPRSNEWNSYLLKFLDWWRLMVIKFKEEQRSYLTVTPEFGPVPYTWKLPNSGEPLYDFFEINLWMKSFLQKQLID